MHRVSRIVNEHFAVRDGELRIGGIAIGDIADRFGTPLYVYDQQAIVRTIGRVRDALGESTEVFYSLKANPSLAVAGTVHSLGVGAEVASAGELHVARSVGFDPADIVFAGPGKTDVELETALDADIHAINVESLAELRRLATLARRRGRPAPVGLRVNRPAERRGAGVRLAGGAKKFGIDHECLLAELPSLARTAALHIRAVHTYAGTQVFDVASLVEHCRYTIDLAREIARITPIDLVDFGGGFGVPYFDNDQPFDLAGFGQAYRDLMRNAHQVLPDVRWVFELGRYLVAEAGVYVTRIVRVKRSRERTYLIADGGMNHHALATGNLGQVFRRSLPVAVVNRLDAPPTCASAVAGPLCTPIDEFGAELGLPRAGEGDLIGVFQSGAYGLTASNVWFLSHATPAEVMVTDTGVQLIRERGTVADLVRGQYLAPLPEPVPECAQPCAIAQ